MASSFWESYLHGTSWYMEPCSPLSVFDRGAPHPTAYCENRTASPFDYDLAGITVAFVVVFAAMILAIASCVTKRRQLVVYLAIVLYLVLGLAILTPNFGYSWHVAKVRTSTEYTASNKTVDVDIGVWVGLRGFNVTMKGVPVQQHNETIDYNERFLFGDSAGVGVGYGPQAGEIRQETRQAHNRGVPYPILYIAEYFHFDVLFIRWGRYYRLGGYYAQILLWAALPFWALGGFVAFVSLSTAAWFILAAGSLMVCATVEWWVEVFKPMPDFNIPFPGGTLSFAFGWSFLFCFVMGIITVVVCSTMLLLQAMDRLPFTVGKFKNNASRTFKKLDATARPAYHDVQESNRLRREEEKVRQSAKEGTNENSREFVSTADTRKLPFLRTLTRRTRPSENRFNKTGSQELIEYQPQHSIRRNPTNKSRAQFIVPTPDFPPPHAYDILDESAATRDSPIHSPQPSPYTQKRNGFPSLRNNEEQLATIEMQDLNKQTSFAAKAIWRSDGYTDSPDDGVGRSLAVNRALGELTAHNSVAETAAPLAHGDGEAYAIPTEETVVDGMPRPTTSPLSHNTDLSLDLSDDPGAEENVNVSAV